MVSARLRLRRVLAVTKYGPFCKTIKLRSINKIVYSSHIILAVTITVVSMRPTFFYEQVSMTEKENGVRKHYLGCANHIIIEKEAFLWNNCIHHKCPSPQK